MRINSINSDNSPSFGRLRSISPDITTQKLKEISSLPFVKNFSRNYDADVDITPYASKTDMKKVRLALTFDQVEPASIYAKIKKLFNKKFNTSLLIKTKTDNYDDFISELSHKRSKSLMNLVHKY